MTSLSPAPHRGPEGGFHVVLPAFEGPLDLLLHLIRVNEVEITDIPVGEIARQYDEMLSLMQELNLEIAGDFLVMAATLVYIKSKLLLPAEQELIAQGLEEDPRAGLVEALLEHQRFRQAAEDLAEREEMAALVFTSPAGSENDEEGYLEASLFDLLKVFKDLIRAAEKRSALSGNSEEIPLADRIRHILDRMEGVEFLTFTEILDDAHTLELLVVTFLAVLELIRMGSLRAVQTAPFAPIRLRRMTN